MAGDDSEHAEIVAPYELHTRESTLGADAEVLTVPEHPGILSTPM